MAPASPHRHGRAARHLCQPGGGASCGACCGLYNVVAGEPAALEARLARNTEVLAETPRNLVAWRAAAARLGAPAPVFPEVRICPLLGFLDDARQRVGCLGHPAATGGPDLRDAGVWDADLCERHQCPSYGWLSPGEADLVRDACRDWWLYGRVVTDVTLVRGVLGLVARARGGAVAPEAIRRRPKALAAFRALLADRPGAVAGAFEPEPDGAPVLRRMDYGRLGLSPAPEDEVVLSLGRAAAPADAVRAARRRVRRRVAVLAGRLDAPRPPPGRPPPP